LGRDETLATAAGAPKALMFGDRKGDLRQIEDLVPGLWMRIDDNLAAAFATGLGKMALDAVHRGLRNQVSGVGDVALLRAALFARRLAREPVLARRQRGIAGIERQLFAAVLEQAPERVDDLLGLIQGSGAFGGFDKGGGQIHGAIVSPEFVSDFWLVSRATSDGKFRRRRPSGEDRIAPPSRRQAPEGARLICSGKFAEINKFEPKTVSSFFSLLTDFFRGT
jgi:hypothetical protein